MNATAIVNLALRNAVPLVGLAFLHWSAANLLMLYFVDTLLAIGVIVAGFLYSQFPAGDAEGPAERLNTIVGYAAGAGLIALVFAIPLGMPIFILVYGVADVSFMDMLRDRGFQLGLALQAVASLVSFRDLAAALDHHTPEALGLKRRFTFVMLRWVGTMIAAYFPLTFILGRFGPLLLVLVYIALSIYAEVRPDRFLAAFGEIGRDMDDVPGADARAAGGAGPGASVAGAAAGSRRRRHRRH